MIMQNVNSSNIASIGYDRETMRLAIRFRTGNLYVYMNVPPEVFDAHMRAPSKGTYHSQFIKNVYPFKRGI